MPIHFYWDDPEQTIARYDFIGKWTWEELYAAMHESWAEIEKLPYVVHSISDLSQTSGVPSSAMTHMRSLSQTRPENSGTMIFVGANAYITTIFQTFNKLFQSALRRELNIQGANTLEEARAILANLSNRQNQ